MGDQLLQRSGRQHQLAFMLVVEWKEGATATRVGALILKRNGQGGIPKLFLEKRGPEVGQSTTDLSLSCGSVSMETEVRFLSFLYHLDVVSVQSSLMLHHLPHPFNSPHRILRQWPSFNPTNRLSNLR